MFLHILTDILRNSILVTGLVVIMMMLIESVDIESHGRFFSRLKKNTAGQVVVSALLGSIPGCIGGFASVSLYSKRMISFGALVAMMAASSGDEAFIMMAMVPDKAPWIFLALFGIAVATGILIDFIAPGLSARRGADDDSSLPSMPQCSCGTRHGETRQSDTRHGETRHFGWKRTVMIAGVLIFIVALASGALAHDHTPEEVKEEVGVSLNLLDEKWMNILFAVLSLILVPILWRSSDRFTEHLWHHVIKRHAPQIFLWTAGVLALIGFGMQHVDISGWIGRNTAVMILLAVAIGMIPESGPHIIFVTMYASGMVPLSVLLASSISQDGHSSLPLLAQDKKSFALAKLMNCGIALIVGFGTMLLS